MLRKKLGTEAIERDSWGISEICLYYKIHSSLIIPESVKEIEDYAFYGCRQATIIHKKDFRYIGTSAFEGCKDVKEEIRS